MFSFEINLIKLGFFLMTISMLIVGLLMNLFEKHLPGIVKKSFRYGKFAYNGNVSIKLLEIPKSWFKHFYIFSSSYATLALLVLYNVYINGAAPSTGFIDLLIFTTGSKREATVSATSALIAMTLLTIQCYRRLYETHFVSVFSTNGKMNISHYIVGFAHYAGAIGAILAEAPSFSITPYGKSTFYFSDIHIYDIIGSLIFIWGWIHQFKAAIIFANLRKNERGVVVTQKHKIPNGDLFEYVSSPHSFSEIVMYVGLAFILRGNTTWKYVLAWVITNQIEASLLAHWWYQETFIDYPKNRKAIIPFVC